MTNTQHMFDCVKHVGSRDADGCNCSEGLAQAERVAVQAWNQLPVLLDAERQVQPL